MVNVELLCQIKKQAYAEIYLNLVLDVHRLSSIIISVHNVAGIAQLVEHNLAKVTVASSILVSRSKWYDNKAVMQWIANPSSPVRLWIVPPLAQVVKLVDTRDLKSLGLNIRAGSTPAPGTILQIKSRSKNKLFYCLSFVLSF